MSEAQIGPLGAGQLSHIGAGLCRPECVVAHGSGLLFTSDWTPPGGVSVIAPSGRVTRILATRPGAGIDLPVRPNGIALEPGGSFLLAHLGAERGGIYRLFPDGRCEVVTDRVGGDPMPPANFVLLDGAHVWISISTRAVPRALGYRSDQATGFLAVHAGGETRIAADDLGYTNECLIAPDCRTLWVNETFARRLTAFDLDGTTLHRRRVVATFGEGVFADGMALAADGSLIVTSIVSNRLLRVADGRVTCLFDDGAPDHVAAVEAAYAAEEMGRPHLDRQAPGRLGHLSSIAFGGAEMRTAYLGSLLDTRLAFGDIGVAGAVPPWWSYDLGPLAMYEEG
ncbi:MAG: SMP-30/gluconolactonase/LRE family protein [Pseudomonadota bacterium]